MESAPIWTDLKTFPWESFRDRVDILTGGYPCQPFSAAGKRAGKEDPRHLWPWIADGIRILRPRVCFFENVEGHISLGLSSVISDLEELGYKVSWGIFSAREVGAPHQRKRVFILAHSSSHGHDGWPIQDGVCGRSVSQLPQPLQGGCAEVRSEVEGCCDNACELADTKDQYGRHTIRPEAQDTKSALRCQYLWPSRPGEPQRGWEPPRVVANGKESGWPSGRVAGDLGGTAPEEGCRGNQPASPATDCGGAGAEKAMGNADHGRLAPRLNARSGTEADRGGQSDIEQAEPRQAQPPLGGNPDGPADWMDYAELYTTCDNRTDELRSLGNGVVPSTAERAFRTLLTELITNKTNI